MGGAAGPWRRAIGLSDILSGQAVDEDRLAELYDLEHDEITEDLGFYREWARRQPGAIVDLGCGSGRLFAAFLAGGASHVHGIDGSPALLRRAEARIAADPTLREARDAGRITLQVGDVRSASGTQRFDLAVLAGVVAHLDGPDDALRAMTTAHRLLAPGGALLVDGLGPGALPEHDLPLSVDWEREVDGRRLVRRSRLALRDRPDGLLVDYATLTDVAEADGTIARLPASFRLWYPTPSALVALAEAAGLEVEGLFGSHDLEPLDEGSERCIVVLRGASADRV